MTVFLGALCLHRTGLSQIRQAGALINAKLFTFDRSRHLIWRSRSWNRRYKRPFPALSFFKLTFRVLWFVLFVCLFVLVFQLFGMCGCWEKLARNGSSPYPCLWTLSSALIKEGGVWVVKVMDCVLFISNIYIIIALNKRAHTAATARKWSIIEYTYYKNEWRCVFKRLGLAMGRCPSK